MIPKNIEEFVKLFVEKPSFEYIKQGRNYFLKTSALSEYGSLSPLFPGLSLGKEDSFFEPSLFLLELLSKESSNKIFLNEEGAWFFLCGRDAFPVNVKENNSKEKIFLVQNSRDENLGYGMRSKSKGKKIIRNLKDRGDFLRREK